MSHLVLLATRRWIVFFVWFAAGFSVAPTLQAQDKSSDSAPTTTYDPEIPVEHLQLLVKPLTKEELVVEADGWRDLLKKIVREIAVVRIGVKNLKEMREDAEDLAVSAAKVQEAEAKSEPDSSKESDALEDDSVDADAATRQDADDTQADSVAASTGDATTPVLDDSNAKKVETAALAKIEEVQVARENAAEQLAVLTEKKAAVVQRLDVVLKDLKLKGGQVEEYRQYIAALTGVSVEVTDASSLWTVIVSWVKSEQGGRRWAWNICRFLLTVLAFYFGASIVANFVRRAAGRVRGASQLLINFLGTFAKQVLMVIGFIVALAALEIDITPLLAAVGAAGFVVGFALQGTLSNFASGLLILAYRPFDVGDVIDAAGVSGVVDSVSLFSTQVRTFDNKLMIVPNNDIWGGTITNATASDTRRVDMVFGIGYDDDIGKAKQLLQQIVESHGKILKDPAPVIKLHELADSSVNFVCRPWTKTEDYWGVYWDLTQTVKEEFDRAGISIPYPQRDVHVYQEASEST